MTSNENVESIEKLIQKAKKVGFDEVPENFDELTNTVIEILRQSGKIMTAKQMHEITGHKNPKWFSDKMWQLAKKGVLERLPTRGYYRFANPKAE